MKDLPRAERDTVREELGSIAERLTKRYKLNIPIVRKLLHEILDVSI